ncbi:TolC family protein [Edaphobacter dinghuensis]|uniref:RND transporter n=1 Tax=Edaphobacter dinghuensis TaxID=1560005 RepID=A0A917H9M9_9BACT|nr:TolC family protein [Edaphobacter dinghuensis]GGG72084.1 RND transporter [Edaphobacter dinghuensis]
MSIRKSFFTIASSCTVALIGVMLISVPLHAQTDLTWAQAKARFETENPTLKADTINVEEMKANEVTANLRPNPSVSLTADQLYPFTKDPYYRPFASALVSGSISYLHERDHKRELRLESAQEGTKISDSQHSDLERNLLFNLRSAFIQTLQAKAVLQLAHQELDYYDHIIDISRDRFKAGDLAQVDLDRIELQRVQYQSDLEAAEVNLRTSKIQLLQLLNDKTPVEQFDIQGSFDFSDLLQPLNDFHQTALDNRPDLKAALEAVQQANTNHKLAVANGSTDPTFSIDSGSNPPLDPYIGFNVSIPLRIFDRNQGEKQRTQLEIGRSQESVTAAQAQVFADVDSAYAQLGGTLNLLRPYKTQYLEQAVRVRDTITFSYQHGGASLLDFLNAQSDYRNVQLAYLQLVGSYLSAASQLNLAVGKEVIQ